MNREEFQIEPEIIGETPEIKEVIEIIKQVAPTNLTVLITGESGTGKEVIAKAIYKNSERKDKNLVTVNCGAIPEGILESELFGHEKGSFTGANELRKGYFELADNGTIFLDEIGELQVATQVKFLRVLENGEFMRVGSGNTQKVDVRVIAATNRDLEDEVQNGKFRPDLFYRLRAINIKVPPLRKRKEDIPLLFDKFLEDACKKNHVEINGISKEAISMLIDYNWPGNIRELKNVVESLVLLENDHIIEVIDVMKYLQIKDRTNLDRNFPIPLNISAEQSERELILRALFDLKGSMIEIKNMLMTFIQRSSFLAPPQKSIEINDNLNLIEIEKKVIALGLEKTNYNKRNTAKLLGISERTLYRKMDEYNL